MLYLFKTVFVYPSVYKSYVCPSVSEVILKVKGQLIWFVTATKRNTTQTVYAILGTQ